MKLYTKGGDQGWTSMLNKTRVSKTDERIELIGSIDELNSHLGLVKAAAEEWLKGELTCIQRILMQMMTEISSGTKGKYSLEEACIKKLERGIDEQEKLFLREKAFVLYGGCELSARLDVARAVARRAERQFYRVAKLYPVDSIALKYMNRLADDLYILARYYDYVFDKKEDNKIDALDTQALCAAVVKEVMRNID